MDTLDRLGLQPVRVLWVLVALVAAGPIGAALDGRSTPVVAVCLVGLWLGWTVGFGALLVPRSSALTVVRVLVPAGLAVTITAAVTGRVDAQTVAAVVLASVATVWAFAPWVGERFVDGSSYGTERRFPLRPPVLFSVVIAPLTWLLVIGGAVAGPLLLAAGRWLIGVPVWAVGWAVAVIGVRSLHQLSRRWVVLVPTGLVLHDRLTMPEPQLVLRRSITLLGPAPADSDARDLTAGAAGLALRLRSSEPVELLVRSGPNRTETVTVTELLFCASRPRRLLDVAAQRRIPIG